LGDIYLNVKVCSVERRKCKVFKLLLDTGATYTVINKMKLQSLDIKPIDEVKLTLTDGSKVLRKIGVARFHLRGKSAMGFVVFGEPKDEEVIGVTVLETMGWSVNFKTGKLQSKRVRF
jgi:predicted aspartyl protease